MDILFFFFLFLITAQRLYTSRIDGLTYSHNLYTFRMSIKFKTLLVMGFMWWMKWICRNDEILLQLQNDVKYRDGFEEVGVLVTF